MPISYSDLRSALQSLELSTHPVIAHASLSAFGHIQGGAESLLGAVLASVKALVMPTFTYKTMITPEVGPPNNGITYGRGRDLNRMAVPFQLDMPADRLMGILPETLRRHPAAHRTDHPILSFSGINADAVLKSQTMYKPLEPIGKLAEQGGWVLLLGVDHTVNTSIHYAEQLAGRKNFIRWALKPKRIVECPAFPGCSSGFQSIEPDLSSFTRWVRVGDALLQALPLKQLFVAVAARIEKDPLALLCRDVDCGRCQATRTDAMQNSHGLWELF
jgi:aminoglycoside 3-N-acetyltransferase